MVDTKRMSLGTLGGQFYGGLKKGTNLVSGELVTNLKDLNEYAKPLTSDALEMLQIADALPKVEKQNVVLVPIKP